MNRDRSNTGRRALVLLLLLTMVLSACDKVLPRRSSGERLYRKHCADCHGLDAAGHTIRHMGDQYANLRDDMWRYAGDARGIERTIRQGLVFRHSSYEELTTEELRAIVDHVLELRGERRR